MPAPTPIERAVATYRPDWAKAKADQPGIGKVNPETLTSTTPSDFRFRYIDITSVNEGAIDWSAVTCIRFADSPSRARRVVRKGDTMICTVRPLLRSHAFAGWAEDEPTVCSTGFAVLRCDGGLLPNFLKHLPFAEQVTRQLIAWQCGTNYPAVNERDIRQLVLPLPVPEEQVAIANILEGVDTAIERTGTAIDKARRVKKSLVQSLFTKGIGHARFRPSVLGQIPSDWKVVSVGDVLREAQYGLSMPMRQQGQYPILRMAAIQDGTVLLGITREVCT